MQEDLNIGRDIADPDLADQKSLLVNGLGYAFEGVENGLDDDLRPELKRATFIEDGSAPFLSLWEGEGKTLNELASFLGRDRLADLESLLGAELVAGYTSEWRSQLLEKATGQIAADPLNVEGWYAIAAIIRDLEPPEHVGKEIAISLGALDLCELAKRAREGDTANLLPLMPSLVLRVRDESVRKHFTAELVRLAQWYGANNGSKVDADSFISLILAHAYPLPDKTAAPEEFHQLCIQLASSFPALGNSLQAIVGRLCSELPADQAADFWPLLIQLRAIA